MYQRGPVFKLILAVLCMAIITIPVCAQTVTVKPDTVFCISEDDFNLTDQSKGIFITSTPSHSVARIYYGQRPIRSGDVLPQDALNQLSVRPVCSTEHNTQVNYYTISDSGISEKHALTLSILPKKNDPPIAANGSMETYRNISNKGVLEASDPENGPLTYTLVLKPKRGTVEINEDGTFAYTPDQNKVGKDSFTFTVTDDAGQTSEPAKISIEIKKPSDKQVYADMTGDEDAFSAAWMRETGLYSGSVIGGNLCFQPETPVSRGEFLVMTMKLVEAEPNKTDLHSGFADEAATPLWMQPYIVSALRSGMISGTEYDGGMEFRPEANLTKAEAAVMLQNILQLPGGSAQAVGAFGSNVPVWAEQSAAALSNAGIMIDFYDETDELTRRDVSKMLYQVHCLLCSDAVPTFYWVS